MSGIYKQHWGFSRRAQRRNVALLIAALVLWLVASAAHIHFNGDHDAPGKRAVVCGVCQSLPAGATPPASSASTVAVQAGDVPIAAPVVPAPRPTVLSSYLSRGPPAA